MNKRARFEEKRTFVIRWLLEFHYSTRSVLCYSMGLKRSSQSNFFVSLMKSGLFHSFKHPLIHEDLIMLTFNGKQFAGQLSSKADHYHATPSRALSSTTIHGLCVQRAVIARSALTLPFDFRGERFLTHIEGAKRPDALVTVDGNSAAIEVELTQKSQSRIYMAYLDHVENMKANLYTKVIYVFSNDSLRRIYEGRCRTDFWPRYYRDSKSKRIRAVMDGDVHQQSKAGSEVIQSRFSFVREDLYP